VTRGAVTDEPSLRAAWEREARDWIRFSGAPDVFAWRFNLPAFLDLLPGPGRLTLDVGCGEGRVARELIARGHRVLGIDASPTLVAAARSGEPPVDAIECDAASVPLDDAIAHLAVSFMALQSVDDLPAVLGETSRLLAPGGRLCFAVVHPMNSAAAAEAGYFEEQRLSFEHERDGAPITLHDKHLPLEAYFEAVHGAGFVTERVNEPIPGQALLDVYPAAERWTRTPCFLHVLAKKQ
jgi:SAM-dependent methyltransferase